MSKKSKQQVYNKCSRILRDAKKVLMYQSKKIREKYIKKIKKELTYIVSSSIDMYYDSFTPAYYDRTGDLYNICKIAVAPVGPVDLDADIIFDYTNMNYHGRKKEYIYDYMFKQGYHGGDIKGPGHPRPGIPYWRKFNPGTSKFDSWGEPAPQTASPYDKIEQSKDEYLQNIYQEYENEMREEVLKPINEALLLVINKLNELYE